MQSLFDEILPQNNNNTTRMSGYTTTTFKKRTVYNVFSINTNQIWLVKNLIQILKWIEGAVSVVLKIQDAFAGNMIHYKLQISCRDWEMLFSEVCQSSLTIYL